MNGGSQNNFPGLLMMKLYVDDVLCIGISLTDLSGILIE